MYRIFKKLIKQLEKEKPFVNKGILSFLKACEDQELAALENTERDYFLYYFNQLYLSMDYNQRIIDSGWEVNISKDPERENLMNIDYSLEEIIHYSPFPYYETGLLFLARMRCRACTTEFIAILPFIFNSEAFDFGNGFQWTIKEFPLTTEGYTEASKLYFDILKDITLERLQSKGNYYLEAYVTENKGKQAREGKIENLWVNLLTEERINKLADRWWTQLSVDLPFVNFREKYKHLHIGTRVFTPDNDERHLPYHKRKDFKY